MQRIASQGLLEGRPPLHDQQRLDTPRAQTELVASDRLATVGKLAGSLPGGDCPCRHALEGAIISDPATIPAEARERFLAIIHRQAERMERLVTDLLRLARLEAGQEVVDIAPCDINALLRGLVSDFEAQATAKQQTLAVTVAPEAAVLNTDAAKLHDHCLEAIVALTEDDTDVPTLSALSEDGPPSVSEERLNAYGEALWAVYDLREIWRSIGPRVAQVIKEATPGRNDVCSCGSGKKYKKCCGAH